MQFRFRTAFGAILWCLAQLHYTFFLFYFSRVAVLAEKTPMITCSELTFTSLTMLYTVSTRASGSNDRFVLLWSACPSPGDAASVLHHARVSARVYYLRYILVHCISANRAKTRSWCTSFTKGTRVRTPSPFASISDSAF